VAATGSLKPQRPLRSTGSILAAKRRVTPISRSAEPGPRSLFSDLLTDERTTLMFRLYYAPDTCALATHIALEEAGAPYEAVPVDFGSQAQRSSEYLAINAKGRVPALVTESGTLTETPDCCSS
jgi:hypothetical protein